MGAFSTTMVASAARLLSTYGEAASFTNYARGAYNVATGTTATSTDTVYTGNVAPTQFSAVEQASEEVLTSDVKLLVEQTTRAPEVDDDVTFSGVTYRVLDVQPVKAQGVDVIYILQVRI